MRKRWESAISIPCTGPALRIWLHCSCWTSEGFPASPSIHPHGWSLFLHTGFFICWAFACLQRMVGQCKPQTSEEWIYVQNLVCVPSVSRETYFPYPNPILTKCCSLGKPFLRRQLKLLLHFYGLHFCWKSWVLFLSRHSSPLKIVFKGQKEW